MSAVLPLSVLAVSMLMTVPPGMFSPLSAFSNFRAVPLRDGAGSEFPTATRVVVGENVEPVVYQQPEKSEAAGVQQMRLEADSPRTLERWPVSGADEAVHVAETGGGGLAGHHFGHDRHHADTTIGARLVVAFDENVFGLEAREAADMTHERV